MTARQEAFPLLELRHSQPPRAILLDVPFFESRDKLGRETQSM